MYLPSSVGAQVSGGARMCIGGFLDWRATAQLIGVLIAGIVTSRLFQLREDPGNVPGCLCTSQSEGLPWVTVERGAGRLPRSWTVATLATPMATLAPPMRSIAAGLQTSPGKSGPSARFAPHAALRTRPGLHHPPGAGRRSDRAAFHTLLRRPAQREAPPSSAVVHASGRCADRKPSCGC